MRLSFYSHYSFFYVVYENNDIIGFVQSAYLLETCFIFFMHDILCIIAEKLGIITMSIHTFKSTQAKECIFVVNR